MNMYTYIYIYIYIYTHIGVRGLGPRLGLTCEGVRIPEVEGPREIYLGAPQLPYTWSPLEDPRLFAPSPWKILRHYL